MLGDIDAQQSSRAWLALRPPGLPAISAWDVGEDRIARPPRGVTHVVLDTPAGIDTTRLHRALRIADGRNIFARNPFLAQHEIQHLPVRARRRTDCPFQRLVRH